MIYLKSKVEINYLQESGSIVGDTLSLLRDNIKEGVSTKELNKIAENNIKKYKGIPAFKGYRGFPFSICSSVNEEIVHGFPNNTLLKHGDIITVDVGVLKNNYYGDAAITCSIGLPRDDINKLLTTTKKCLLNSIENFKENCKVGDISNVIQETAFVNGFNVIKNYGGHGVGRKLHEDPFIPNYGKQNFGLTFHHGSVIAIEPILTPGNGNTKHKKDGWTVITEDYEMAAHFEHTVCLTENGPLITTKNE